MITTTLTRLREHSLCADSWDKLLRHLGKTKADAERLPFAVILESNGLDDAIWCCRVEPQYAREWRLYAVWCARQVQHLMRDKRSLDALDVAERYAIGEATDDELEAAWSAARDADCGASRDVTQAAARDITRKNVWATALDAWNAALVATCVADLTTSWAVAYDAARDAARDAVRADQSAEFLRLVTETEDRHHF